MSRTVVVRGLGVFIALSLVVGMCMITYVTGCNSADLGSDFGLVEPGCRTPSGCFTGGVDCPCHRSDVFGSPGILPSCESSCNTSTGISCVCNINNKDAGVITTCQEAANVCVGRAASTCDGVGARCLAVGGSCSGSDTGAPPNKVGTGLNGTLEARCPYVDDVCCPGTMPAADAGAVTDGGDDADVDGGTTDL
ncbi:MAG: hypothetical protein ABI321_10275 [Polyangia bacterium]